MGGGSQSEQTRDATDPWTGSSSAEDAGCGGGGPGRFLTAP